MPTPSLIVLLWGIFFAIFGCINLALKISHSSKKSGKYSKTRKKLWSENYRIFVTYIYMNMFLCSETSGPSDNESGKKISIISLRPWSFKPVTDITGWYFFPVILFLLFPDKSIYSTSINWAIGNALMKPITDYKWQEQDYRKKMSACNVSYRLKRSGP